MTILQRAGRITLAVAAFGLVSTGSSQVSAQSDIDLTDAGNQIGYAIGVNIGQNLQQQQIISNIDFDAFVAGMRDAVEGNVQMDDQQMMTALQTFTQQMEAAQQNELAANQAASEEFLAQNGQRDGVVTLDSGLQYLVLVEGPAGGTSPTTSDSVLAHYHGTLPDGTVFDSSVDRGEPATFGVSQVIAGWTEALQLMSEGDKWRLFIPPGMAYGEASPTPAIPPNSALVFDVELLEVQ
ncbi:MAG: FKBP-type peptidyl-prolyl cis-trans isomerase [Pseudohongiellaceae bacterium]